MPRLILASQSPRRRDLLEALGIPFDVVPSHADEALPVDLPLGPALEAVALRKAREVAASTPAPSWVLGADTAVVVGDEALGKPRDRGDAVSMLEALSARTHRVITAVALVGPTGSRSLRVETAVTFAPLTPAQIAWYADLDEPYDKAGAYAIQGRGAFLVSSIRGSYTNVVGLPMTETVSLLEGAGFAPWPRGEADRG
ncbi:MAG: septum formation protein Maf [Deltaproteobacteria bacterium]|nr:septum formation protein Maf [Deltaproteobacteria bacterium]